MKFWFIGFFNQKQSTVSRQPPAGGTKKETEDEKKRDVFFGNGVAVRFLGGNGFGKNQSTVHISFVDRLAGNGVACGWRHHDLFCSGCGQQLGTGAQRGLCQFYLAGKFLRGVGSLRAVPANLLGQGRGRLFPRSVLLGGFF